MISEVSRRIFRPKMSDHRPYNGENERLQHGVNFGHDRRAVQYLTWLAGRQWPPKSSHDQIENRKRFEAERLKCYGDILELRGESPSRNAYIV